MYKSLKLQKLYSALRIDFISLWGLMLLLFGAFAAWGIAEYTTSYFQTRIEKELRAVITSDIEVSGRVFPSEIQRENMREIAKKYGANISESVVFPYVVEQSGTGARFIQAEVHIVDSKYPLYGKLEYDGDFSGAIVQSDMYNFLSGGSIQIGANQIPLSGKLIFSPDMNANPFVQNKSIYIRESSLPFGQISSSGSIYRYEYEAGFSVDGDKERKAILQELRATLNLNSKQSVNTGDRGREGLSSDNEVQQTDFFRIREQRADGGNFTDIANTVNDFFGAILFASMLIALSSFMVAFLRFVQERGQTTKILHRMGVTEKQIIQAYLSRFILLVIGVLSVFFLVWIFLPETKAYQYLQLGIYGIIILFAMIWLLFETILNNFKSFSNNKKFLRILAGVSLFIFTVLYFLIGGKSVYPLLYALGALVLMERIVWLLFRFLPLGITRLGIVSKRRFYLLDALRSFQAAPILGKVSFSIFFLLSGTLTVVFLFSLTFRESLINISQSPLDAYVVNISKQDYEKLVAWNNPSDFYSSIRARIEKINGKTLAEHIGSKEVPRQFSREFSITDSATKEKIISGTSALLPTEITIDADFGKNIGIEIGDSVTFTLAGRSFTFDVVGIRESKRSGISPFFFFQIPQDAIAGAPKTYFLTTDIGNQSMDDWKARVLKDSGGHVMFIDIRPILEEVISYSKMVLFGVMILFFYVGVIGIIAFVLSERTFLMMKIRKVQLYRLFGATKDDGYKLLFFESVLGNIFPLFLGVLAGGILFLVFIRSNPILRLSSMNGLVVVGIIILFFIFSYWFTRSILSKQINKTNPQIGGSNENL